MVTPSIKLKSFSLLLLALFTGLVFMYKYKSASNSIFQSHKKPNAENATVDFDSILKRGKLIVLTDYSSTGYFIYKGEPMGFEYELLSDFCKSTGIELELKLAKNLDDVFWQLNNGDVDIVAANLTITKERLTKVNFTKPILYTCQVLVQRKPDNWKKLTQQTLNKKLIRNVYDLVGKEIYVRRESSFYERLQNISEEIGGDINIIAAPGTKETEELISMVAGGVIDFTVADENVAMVNQTYFPNIDTKTELSLPQQIAWAVRKNSEMLLSIINNWIVKAKRKGNFSHTYAKYFQNNRGVKERIDSDYFSQSGNNISEYDELIKKYATKINWDWRMLASLICQKNRGLIMMPYRGLVQAG